MHDTFLLNKISETLKNLCDSYKISKVEFFTIIVNENSHITEENLLEHLRLNNGDIIADTLTIDFIKDNLEEQTAIIQSIQGETLGSDE